MTYKKEEIENKKCSQKKKISSLLAASSSIKLFSLIC